MTGSYKAAVYLKFSVILNILIILVTFFPLHHTLTPDLSLATTSSCGPTPTPPSTWSIRDIERDRWSRHPKLWVTTGKVNHDKGLGQTGAVGQVKELQDCSMCAVAPELCKEIGENNMRKAQAYLGVYSQLAVGWSSDGGYLGTGERIQRFIAKAKSGEGFTVGVIGGSVSNGQGLGTPLNKIAPMNLHRRIFDHLNELFPAKGGVSIGRYEEGKNSFVSGALGGTGSDYFSYCFHEHIPQETDLVFLELSINDELLLKNFESYENLIRGVLDMPNHPAILNLQVFALVFKQLALGGDIHEGVSQFYDIPIISLRGAILHDILANASLVPEYFIHHKDGSVDVRHISQKGHRVQGELGIAYLQTQVCEMGKREDLRIKPYQRFHVAPLPRMRLMQPYDDSSVTPRLSPNCLSAHSEGSNRLVPSMNDGWREWAWEDKNYWVSDKPMSKADFNFTTVLGTVELFYLRSKTFKLGNIACWVDDDDHKAVTLIGHWEMTYNIGQ
ncbi:hypothetical protein L198_04951 [Cryptococcus wingfieldii CBS 7118]|uniref:Uncharacterized protein n=1 Tax=Cryptococcus wingfieldii CBS 7118 TaxID=1295528 RepID=A0A1E3J1U4_9TREE|nr:hypothetical protein L198_04951 [Cryptococcus wingfieldii CBS 7118]ODN94804.1 hypothetical protein L198_04951 [Cryptococcus wingfieldii CBS 7118]